MSVEPWLQIGLSVLAGLITGGLAMLGVRRAIRRNADAADRRDDADRREEWWRRFTWAGELSLSEDPRSRVAGLDLLSTLAQLDSVDQRDLLLMDAFHRRVLESYERPDPRREHPDR